MVTSYLATRTASCSLWPRRVGLAGSRDLRRGRPGRGPGRPRRRQPRRPVRAGRARRRAAGRARARRPARGPAAAAWPDRLRPRRRPRRAPALERRGRRPARAGAPAADPGRRRRGRRAQGPRPAAARPAAPPAGLRRGPWRGRRGRALVAYGGPATARATASRRPARRARWSTSSATARWPCAARSSRRRPSSARATPTGPRPWPRPSASPCAAPSTCRGRGASCSRRPPAPSAATPPRPRGARPRSCAPAPRPGLFRGCSIAPERRPGSRPAEARRRLEQELGTIAELGFAPYFLVVDEIVQLARAHGIPVFGRGSAADSLVAHRLVTDADLAALPASFERFLNADRFRRGEGDPLPRRRPRLSAPPRRAVGLVARRFDGDRVALLSTVPTLGFRAARARSRGPNGLPRRSTRPTAAPAACRGRSTPPRSPPPRRRPAARADRGPRRSSGGGSPAPPGLEERRREARMLRGAFALVGAHRCLGLHPGGTVLAPVPARDLMPLERAAKGLVCVQWDKHVAPRMGLVKIDLLGNHGLSIFEDAQRELLRLGVSLEAVEALRETPEEDPQAAALARAGRTLGVFQVESPGMRALLTRVDAGRCDDVIRALALIRPGPAGSGMLDRYVRRVRGLEPTPALPPGLGPVLGDSRGVMLYQEDVIHVLAALTGLPLGQADLLRRDLGKECRGAGRRAGAGDGPATARFHALCAARASTRPRPTPSVQLARFGGYSFNKAHAVTYGRLAWRILRAKAQQPAALFAAILANDTGYHDKRVYVEEARRLEACRCSRPAYRWRSASAPSARAAPGPRAARRPRRGQGPARGLRRGLVADREDRGPHFAADELVGRVGERGLTVEEDWIERLILVGAFDLLEGTRPEKLWRFRVGFGRRRRRAAAPGPAGGELFPGALERRAPIIPCLPEYSDAEKARLEVELLGYPIRAHAITYAPPLDDAGGCLPLSEVPAHVGRSVQVLGWLAATRRHRTRGGEWMCFLTLEDAGGMVEAVLFPAVFRRCGGELAGQGRYRLRGRVELREGAVALHADMLERVDGE
ncbi:MAG: hypothetical protein R3F30_02505 [Planctomycetota bacterium]